MIILDCCVSIAWYLIEIHDDYGQVFTFWKKQPTEHRLNSHLPPILQTTKKEDTYREKKT